MHAPTRRRRPAHWLPAPDHPSPIVFVTCCTRNRRACLASHAAHEVLRAAWRSAASWQVGCYVVMPDHLHFFCAPASVDVSLERWMAYWRSLATRWLGEPRAGLWQRDFWDRQLRHQESYAEKWEYVRHNPVRADLAERPEDWPFHGEMNRLEWRRDR